MKRKILSVLALLLALLCIPAAVVLAHPGRTDANGGHYNRSTGEYHYHHGYPAHQHPNGVCPYLTDTSEDSTDTYYDSSQQDDDNVGGYFINDDVSSQYSDLSDAAEQLGGNYTTKVLTDISSTAYMDGYLEGYEDGLAYREKNPTAAAASAARGDAETISELGGYTGKDYNVGVSNAYDEGYADALEEGYSEAYEDGYADAIALNSQTSMSTESESKPVGTTSNKYIDELRMIIMVLFLIAFFALIAIFVLYKLWQAERVRAEDFEGLARMRGKRIEQADAYIDRLKNDQYLISSPDDDEED